MRCSAPALRCRGEMMAPFVTGDWQRRIVGIMDVVCVVGPVLLIAIALAAVWLDRWSVPVILVALGAGILFGSDVLRLWHFGDIGLANRVANLALVFILFHGGFSTRRSDFKAVALPAAGLATWA